MVTSDKKRKQAQARAAHARSFYHGGNKKEDSAKYIRSQAEIEGREMSRKIMSEFAYARVYGSANLIMFSNLAWESLYLHGPHNAEFCRLYGDEAYESLLKIEKLHIEENGIEDFLRITAVDFAEYQRL